MFNFELFLIALLVCVLGGKSEEGDQSEGRNLQRNIRKDLFDGLTTGEKSERSDQSGGADFGKLVSRHTFNSLLSDGHIDMNSTLGQCFEQCILRQQGDLNNGKKKKQGLTAAHGQTEKGRGKREKQTSGPVPSGLESTEKTEEKEEKQKKPAPGGPEPAKKTEEK